MHEPDKWTKDTADEKEEEQVRLPHSSWRVL